MLINHCARGKGGGEDRPFFMQDRTNQPENQEWDPLFLIDLSLPVELYELFNHFKNLHEEYYIDNWTIMCLKSIHKRHTIFKQDNQHKIVDFAFRYRGMGYIDVAYYVPDNNTIHTRIDGGSCGVSRDKNFKNALAITADGEGEDATTWFNGLFSNL